MPQPKNSTNLPFLYAKSLLLATVFDEIFSSVHTDIGASDWLLGATISYRRSEGNIS